MDELRFVALRRGIGVLALPLFACQGAVTGAPDDDPSDPVVGDPTKPGEIAFACAPGDGVEVGPTPMRRLAHEEYDNTIEALLGDASRPSEGFTKDPILLGYDNNVSALGLSPALADDYFDAADAIAMRATAAANLGNLAPCATQPGAGDACARTFVKDFGARAYRRPLSSDEEAALLKVYTTTRAAGDDFATGIRLVLQTMLQAPQFLYRAEVGAGARQGGAVKLDGYEVAARLSYLLWGTMPDDALTQAAAAGQLVTTEQAVAQAERLLADPRARRGLARFLERWAPARSMDPTVTKDATAFPDWQSATPGHLRAELARFLDHVAWTDGARLETFLTASYSFHDKHLASFYKSADPAARQSDALVPVQQDPTRHAGFMTKGAVMAVIAKAADTSPVGRGVFVRERLLCLEVPPPPVGNNAAPELPKKPDNIQMKDWLGQHRADPNCANCHALFDPLGLAFENFDATGRWRAEDAGAAIDAAGDIAGGTSIDGAFAGPVDMIKRVASSAEARACFVKQVFRFAAGRAETPTDGCALKHADDYGRASGYDVRQVVLGLVRAPGFLHRQDDTTGGQP